MTTDAFDLIILGAGPVGAALACMLADGQRIAIVDPEPDSADNRGLALSWQSWQILNEINALNADDGWPIRHVAVSHHLGFGRTVIEAATLAIPALGFCLPGAQLRVNLLQQLSARSVKRYYGWRAAHTMYDGVCHHVDLVDDNDQRTRLYGRLLVHAEGAPAANTASVEHRRFDYGQTALIAQVDLQAPPADYAWEHFGAHSVIALLPYGKQYMAIITTTHAQAAQLAEYDDAGCRHWLNRQLNGRVALTAIRRLTTFALDLTVRKNYQRHAEIWLGNAAQKIHPIAGQGMNLALRDARQLAHLVRHRSQHASAWRELSRRYYAETRVDRSITIGLTHSLARLPKQGPIARLAGLGVSALSLLPPFKHQLSHRLVYGNT